MHFERFGKHAGIVKFTFLLRLILLTESWSK